MSCCLQNELRCRCAYNTSLNMREEQSKCCDKPKTPTCSPAPMFNPCVNPCEKPKSCAEPCPTPKPCPDPCEKPKPCADPCAKPKPCADPCAKPKPCADPCAKPKPCADPCSPQPKLCNEPCPKPNPCDVPCTKPNPCAEPCPKPYKPCVDYKCASVITGCYKPRSCNENVCTRLNDDCGNFNLTSYGQQFVVCTNRVAQKCACVKFNGLQDNCKHPDCCVRRGCLEKPFPTCPPARKWRFDYVCCRNKTKKCKPQCKN